MYVCISIFLCVYIYISLYNVLHDNWILQFDYNHLIYALVGSGDGFVGWVCVGLVWLSVCVIWMEELVF